MSEQKGYWSHLINLQKVTKQPVLLGFNAASYGVEVESFSDKEIVSQAMGQLKKMYGKIFLN